MSYAVMQFCMAGAASEESRKEKEKKNSFTHVRLQESIVSSVLTGEMDFFSL